MAIDKAVDSAVLDSCFASIAEAIRAKNGESALYTPEEMVSAIAAIETGASGLTYGIKEAAQMVTETGLSAITDYILVPAGTTTAQGLIFAHYKKEGSTAKLLFIQRTSYSGTAVSLWTGDAAPHMTVENGTVTWLGNVLFGIDLLWVALGSG